MILLQGYTTGETLYQGGSTNVFRGTRTADGVKVVCKLLKMEYPTLHDLSSFRREYEIGARFSGEGTATYLALEKVKNSLAIVMADDGDDSMERDASLSAAGIDEKLAIAAGIAKALTRVHQGHVIHKDINPSNILVHRATNTVKLVDFGIAAELTRETANLANAGALEGTLAYISPEQTGRMNRPVDHRTDLYSLGVTLFQLFTGRLPFPGTDALDLVHAHLARVPPIPHEINPDIPETVSAIILKLLAKTPEDRYQSATGLLADLDRCREDLARKGSVGVFAIGQSDGSDRFATPGGLYGRDKEIATLRSSYEVVAGGGAKLVLLAGTPGVGKTALVREMRKFLPGGNGFLISGKYNQLEKNFPYSGIFQAFRDLTEQLLCEPAEVLQARRRSILEALGANAGLLIDLVPKLGMLLGKQDPPPPLDPVAAHYRLQIVVREFIQAFVRDGHSLVLFLDDLQWSDSPSLDLVRQLLGAGGIPRLLLVGAYRDGEVGAGHPLAILLKALEERCGEADAKCTRLNLDPLGFDVVNQLVADTLRRDPEEVRALATLVHGKTDGNPFFTHQLLASLHAHGAFTYRPEENHWDTDLNVVATAEPSDNLADFLARRLKSLPEATKSVLRIAACIGNTFDLRTLAAAFGRGATMLHQGLWDAIAKEIVVPLDRAYRLLAVQPTEREFSGINAVFKFQHDRLLQAVRALVPPEDESTIRHSIGREMLAAFREAGTGSSLFELVGHLNAARLRITEKEERLELARLNLMAAGQAMSSTAFKKAAEHYATAEALLTDGEWGDLRGKRFEVALAHAEAIFLSGDPAGADERVGELVKLASGNLEQAAVHTLKSRILESRGDLAGALQEIRAGLLDFGLILPQSKEDIERRVGEGLGRMGQGFARTPVDELARLPRMEDPETIAAMRLLTQAVPAAIQHNYQLYMVVTMMMADLTLSHGLTPESCKCIADCGIIYSSVLGDYETGYRLGKAAFTLIDRLAASWQRPPVCFSFTYVSHMRKHFREGLDHYEMSYRSGLEVGDMQHAYYARSHKIHMLVWVGADLLECRREAEATIAYLKEGQGIIQLMLANLVLHAIRKLEATPDQDEERELARIDGETMATIGQTRSMVLLVRFAQYNAFLHFILGDTETAERWNATAESVIFASGTDFPVADHYLVQCLLCVDRLKDPATEDRPAIEAKLFAAHAKLAKMASHCPENFAHKHRLVSAELSALRGEPLETTLELYREALGSIGEGDFTQLVALINERQGAFWIARGEHTVGRAFLREARYHYARWGAFRKVDAMEANYREHFAFFGQTPGDGGTTRTKGRTHRTSNALSNAMLDITSITKSTQSISGEIRIGNLLRTLLQTIIENAGAQSGCFLLANDAAPRLHVAALKEASSDTIEILAPSLHHYSDKACPEIVEYVERTRESLVLDDANAKGRFAGNEYIRTRKVKSVLCMPVLRRNALKGIVYLENNLTDHAFTTDRLSILAILASQASISIENAQLYEDMEGKVRERTKQLNEANERLKQLTLIDPLTHLNNRRFFHDYIAGAAESYIRRLNRARSGTEKRAPESAALMGVYLIDIDHFKAVNDTWGHAAGDSVLVGISKALKAIIRSDDFIVRWGGEEFLVILNNTSPLYLDRFARKVLKAVRETPIPLPGQPDIVKTCSVGYTQIPFTDSAPDFLTLEQTIKLSDYALYVAKQHGRNRAVRIGIQAGQIPDGVLKDCLVSLSQNSPNDVAGIEITHIREDG